MRQVTTQLLLIALAIAFIFPDGRANDPTKVMGQRRTILYDFKPEDEIQGWRIVNDDVMGGRSKSEFLRSDNNTVTFKGNISLQNNGGFASIRTIPREFKLGGHKGISLRVRGDGKTYQLRLRTNERFDGVSYRYQFKTKSNSWEIVDAPFHQFVPVFRGRVLNSVEPLSPKEIQQIGFLITNKKAENFNLEIDWIKAY